MNVGVRSGEEVLVEWSATRDGETENMEPFEG
jgi:hypothetical protein